jgi:hypothetical protein
VARIRIMSSAGLPEAFAAIRASVALYRRLAAGIPAAFAGDLTHSLALAADVLEDLGKRDQAASLRLLLEAGALDKAARSLSARTPRNKARAPGTRRRFPDIFIRAGEVQKCPRVRS